MSQGVVKIEETGAVVEAENINVVEAEFYSTIKGEDTTTRAKVYNAISDAESLSDHLNKPITVADIIIQKIEIIDEATGEAVQAPRVILIDDKDKAYAAVSKGILGSVQSIINLIGEPKTWDKPLAFVAVETKTRKGFKVMKLKVA